MATVELKSPEARPSSKRLQPLLLAVVACVGLLLSVFGPVERAVSRFTVDASLAAVDVSLPLSNRAPELLRLTFSAGQQTPTKRVTVFSSVAQDVAWQIRPAGALRMVVDVDGLWLVSKNDWVLVSGLVPASDYQLDVYRDRSAVLFEKTSTGSFSEKVRLSSGQVPPFEVTGVHSRNEGVVEFKQIEVTTTTSEIPRPSKWMFLGYALIGIASLSVVFGEWLRFRRSERTESRERLLAGIQQNRWLWVATLVAIVIVPPSHSESWLVQDFRRMQWVSEATLGEHVARPFGGLFYYLLSLWTKVVTPVWMLRLPIAVLFVVSASVFARNCLVDLRGQKLTPRARTVALLVLSLSVFGQGEWLRPEITILSLWLLAMSLLARLEDNPRLFRISLILVGLLLGMMMHHPLGAVAAVSITVFFAHQIRVLARAGKLEDLFVSTVIAVSVAASSALFGQNLLSFSDSLESWQADSAAHGVRFQLFDRLADLNNSTLLLSFTVALCVASVLRFTSRFLGGRQRVCVSYLSRLFPSALVSLALLVPAGPWALYFVYLGPLTAVILSAVSSEQRDSWPKVAGSVVAVSLALFVRALNQPLAESVFLVIGVSGALIVVALALSQNLLPLLGTVSFLGSSLVLAAPVLESVAPTVARDLSERCNRSPSPGRLIDLHGDCFYTWSTTDGSQWGDWVTEAVIVSRASGGAYKPVSLTWQRLIGYGADCGFFSKVSRSSDGNVLLDGADAHIAFAYAMLSPCTDSPDTHPNLEGVARVIHSRSRDMLFFNRVLASILEYNGMSADMLCLSRDGVTETTIPIEAVVTIDEPNCVVLTSPFRQVLPDSIQWSEYSR